MNVMRPRVVVVTRPTPLEMVQEQHGTQDQAAFYLASRGHSFKDYLASHQQFQQALERVMRQIPADQRRVRVHRSDLDRFLFAPDDVVVVVGQDGLVANVAKYLTGQPVVGVNSNPDRFDGVLCSHRPDGVRAVLAWVEASTKGVTGPYRHQTRVMAEALREDGQRLLALNEVFVGHASHQSAQYVLRWGSRTERQSSSGLICSTGTGSTGWARSVCEQRGLPIKLPDPEQAQLAFFVREPFPSKWTGTDLDIGLLEAGETLVVESLMGERGVVFADGIETDCLQFLDGHRVTLSVAKERLNLVVASVKGQRGSRRALAQLDSSES